jgi:hypothetical protein
MKHRDGYNLIILAHFAMIYYNTKFQDPTLNSTSLSNTLKTLHSHYVGIIDTRELKGKNVGLSPMV